MRRRRLALAMLATLVVVPAVVSAAAGAAAAFDPAAVGALTARSPLVERTDERHVLPDVSTEAPSDEPGAVPSASPSEDGRDDGQAVPIEMPNVPPIEPAPVTDDAETRQDAPTPAVDLAEPPSPAPIEASSPIEVPAEPPAAAPTEPPTGEEPAEDRTPQASTSDPGEDVEPAPEGASSVAAPVDDGAASSPLTREATPLEDSETLAGETLAVSVTTDLELGTVVVGASTEDVPFAMAVTNASGLGWQVTVDGADLVHADDPSHTIPRSAVFLAGGAGDGPLVTEITPHSGFLPEDGALLLVEGTAAATGQFALVDGPTLRLDLPSDAVPGSYRTTLTYTIMSQP